MKCFLGLSAILEIIVCSVFLYNLHGDSEVVAQDADPYRVNLQEKVTKPTKTSCKRRRSTDESSDDSMPTFDDCIAYRFTCPDEIKISWLQTPPFLYDANRNDNKSQKHIPNIKGVFHDVLTRAIGHCCTYFAGKIPQIRFLERAPNLMDLRSQLFDRSTDMIIPVHSDEEKYGGSFPYVKILDSPGVILIVPVSQSPDKEWKVVFKAVLGTWPVVVMAFLMSSVAGVIIWILDSKHNPDEFPRRFDKGAWEGFWWAIVTITTIGYGDKTPKSALARLFAVLWILVGVTVCSVMTATLTDALTSVKLEKYDVTSGKRVGVLKDSTAFRDAVNLAANITVLEDQDQMYDSLMNAEGIDVIMEDIFIGIESMKTNDKSNQMSIAKFIGRNRGYGVAYTKHLFVEGISDCLSNVIKFRYEDVLHITRKYIKESTAVEGRNALSENERDTIKVFDPESQVFLVCVITLSAFLIFCLVGCSIGVFFSKFLNREQLDITTKTRENSTTKVSRLPSRETEKMQVEI